MFSRVLPEATVSAILVAACALLAVFGWRTYEASIMPAARFVPTVTPTPLVDLDQAREAAKKQRQVIDYVGAGIAFKQNGDVRAAADEFRRALALDPGNVDARANLREMGIEPPAGVAFTPTATRPTPVPTVTPRSR
jgi:hypothetical protein